MTRRRRSPAPAPTTPGASSQEEDLTLPPKRRRFNSSFEPTPQDASPRSSSPTHPQPSSSTTSPHPKFGFHRQLQEMEVAYLVPHVARYHEIRQLSLAIYEQQEHVRLEREQHMKQAEELSQLSTTTSRRHLELRTEQRRLLEEENRITQDYYDNLSGSSWERVYEASAESVSFEGNAYVRDQCKGMFKGYEYDPERDYGEDFQTLFETLEEGSEVHTDALLWQKEIQEGAAWIKAVMEVKSRRRRRRDAVQHTLRPLMEWERFCVFKFVLMMKLKLDMERETIENIITALIEEHTAVFEEHSQNGDQLLVKYNKVFELHAEYFDAKPEVVERDVMASILQLIILSKVT